MIVVILRYFRHCGLPDSCRRPVPCGGPASTCEWASKGRFGADLFGAELRGAELRGANLAGAELHLVDFRGADLTDANFQGARVAGAKLQNVALTNADLTPAELSGPAWVPKAVCGAGSIGACRLEERPRSLVPHRPPA